MRVDEVIWDEQSEDHIWRHGVEADEVEDILLDHGRKAERTRGRLSGRRRYLVWGVTDAGRHLLVVLDYLGHGTARVVTARDMTDNEKRRFKS